MGHEESKTRVFYLNEHTAESWTHQYAVEAKDLDEAKQKIIDDEAEPYESDCNEIETLNIEEAE